jgi:hypothetical protein
MRGRRAAFGSTESSPGNTAGRDASTTLCARLAATPSRADHGTGLRPILEEVWT